MAVKAPGQRRVGVKGGGRRHAGEFHARPRERRIRLPEALVAAKIGQSGVHPHAGAGGHDQQIGLGDEGGGVFKRDRIHAQILTSQSKHDKYLKWLL